MCILYTTSPSFVCTASVINAEEQQDRAKQLEAEALAREEEEQRAAAERATVAAAERADEAAAAAVLAEDVLVAQRKADAEALPDEPPAGADATTVVARMPDGRRLNRRFGKETELRVVRRNTMNRFLSYQ